MCCPNTLQRRWRMYVYLRWMYETVSCWQSVPVRLYWCVCLNLKILLIVLIGPFECMEWYRVGRVRTESTFVLVCWIWSCYWCSKQYVWGRNLTLIFVQIHYNNGDGGWHLFLSNVWNGVMLVGDEQEVRLYWSYVISSSCTVQLHFNGNDGCVFIPVECTERCGVCVRTDRTFVLVCARMS